MLASSGVRALVPSAGRRVVRAPAAPPMGMSSMRLCARFTPDFAADITTTVVLIPATESESQFCGSEEIDDRCRSGCRKVGGGGVAAGPAHGRSAEVGVELGQADAVARRVAEPESMPYGLSSGCSVNSTPRPRARRRRPCSRRSSRNTVPAKPLAISSRICSSVSSSITGGAGDRHQHDRHVGLAGGPDRQPAEVAELRQGDVGAHLHAEFLGVEGERLVLVVDPQLGVAILIMCAPPRSCGR